MPRQFGVGLLTKVARRNLVSPSPFLRPPFHQHASFSTLSPPSHSWRICITPNGTSLLATRFFSNAILHNLPTKCPHTIRNTTSQRSFNSLDRRRRSIFRRFTTDGVVLGLIMTNAVVYLLWWVEHNSLFMVKNFVITLHHIKEGRLHVLVTNAFSHADIFHLITNILGLYFFGTNIGRSFGPEYLLKLYLGGAIAGSIFFVAHQALLAPPLKGKKQGTRNSIIPFTMGAGGAVDAIMLLDVFLFPTTNILLLGVFIGGLHISWLLKGDPLVSASTHVGGAVVAAFAWLIDRKRRFGRL